MANIDKYRYSVGNFSYASKERAEEAVKEQQRIEKLESQMDYNKPQLVYTLYCKVLEGSVFTTPQGILYLVHLQDYLVSVRKQLGGDIPMIPEDLIRKAKSAIDGSIANGSTNDMTEKSKQNNSDNNSENNNSESEENAEEGKGTSSEKGKKGGKDSTAGMRAVLKQKKKLEENLLISRIVILFLVVLVVAMLIIAGVSDSPTILNYKKQIQNEYVEWQQQLEEKEAELREREALLNESNPYSSGNSNSNGTKMNDEEN